MRAVFQFISENT